MCEQENSHRLTTVMYPDDGYENKRQMREEARLHTLTSNLSKDDITILQRKGDCSFYCIATVLSAYMT